MGTAAAIDVATFFAAPSVRAFLKFSLLFQMCVAFSTKETTGHLVAGFLLPVSPALVQECTNGPNCLLRGLSLPIEYEPNDFQASTATAVTASLLMDGRPIFWGGQQQERC